MARNLSQRLASAAAFDAHVVATLCFRVWSVFAGIGTLVMVPLHLSPVEQGYYYTFGGIIALQIFFELGLNQVLTQFTSHEAAHLDFSDRAGTRASPHYRRLASLVRTMSRWYSGLAVAFAVVVGSIGIVFFARTGKLEAFAWAPSWLALLLASSLNLWLSPRLAFLEGCGRVGDVARMRVVQSVIGYGCMWLALLGGAGLYATPIVPVVAALYSWWWVGRHGALIREAAAEPVDPAHTLRWRTEILPLQWRISLSWVSSYLIFNLFTPVVFARIGEAEAGRVGMSLAVFNAITLIGMSWINAKAPRLSMLVARRELAEMKAVFQAALVRSTGAIALASVAFIACAAQLKAIVPRAGARLLPNDVLVYLALVAVANGIVFSAATYLRSFKTEPMLAVSIVTGLLSAASIWLGSSHGTAAMLQLYAAVIVFVCLPWTLWLLRQSYRAR